MFQWDRMGIGMGGERGMWMCVSATLPCIRVTSYENELRGPITIRWRVGTFRICAALIGTFLYAAMRKRARRDPWRDCACLERLGHIHTYRTVHAVPYSTYRIVHTVLTYRTVHTVPYKYMLTVLYCTVTSRQQYDGGTWVRRRCSDVSITI